MKPSRFLSILLLLLALPAWAEQSTSSASPIAVPTFGTGNPYLRYTPPPTFGDLNPFGLLPKQTASTKPYSMLRSVTQQEKIRMMQMMLPWMTTVMGMNMAEGMNYFARKYKAKPGLSFQDVKDSLFLRANQRNVKFVGENLMWKDFHAVLDDKAAPRIEVTSWCDIAVARELLKISPEFIVFLPCRVVIMEDANKDIWVLMLDWSLDWVKGFENQLGISPELLKGAIDLNARMDDMMRAAANGDL